MDVHIKCEITEKHSKNAKKHNLLKTTKMLNTEI